MNQPAVTGPDGVARPYIGGQALIEGVMMRSPHAVSVVVRRRDGTLVVREEAVEDVRVGYKSLPLVRGVVTLVESLKLGSRSLRFAAEIFEQDLVAEEERAKRPPTPSTLALLTLPILRLLTADPGDPLPAKKDGEEGRSIFTWLTTGIALLVFVALPQAVAAGINQVGHLGLDVRDARFQVMTGVAKLCIVVGYMLLIRRIPEIYRVFQFHGAEHKSIHAYESGQPLTVANAKSRTTLHPRCGTTFLVMVALVSIVVFTALGPLLPRFGASALVENVLFLLIKLPFLPLIAAVTFEIQRVLARYCTTGPLSLLLWPGFMVQKITTIEPDDAQLEVALAALGTALARESRTDATAADRSFESFSAWSAAVEA